MIWRKLKQYPLYQANQLGKIRNIKTKQILKQYNIQPKWQRRHLPATKERLKAGCHQRVNLHINGIIKHCSIHRLIAIAFIPNPLNKPTVNHRDGIKYHNHISNLEWSTQREQQLHAFANGLQVYKGYDKRGSNNPAAKLNQKKADKIRKLIKKGMAIKDIAAKYNVTRQRIWGIKNNKIWIK